MTRVNRRGFLGIVGVTVSVPAVAGCTGESNEKKLDIGDIEYVRENEGNPEETMAVKGVAENVSGTTLNDVSIIVEFTDSNGITLGEASTSRSSLDPDDTWEFEVEFPKTGETASRVSSTSIKSVV